MARKTRIGAVMPLMGLLGCAGEPAQLGPGSDPTLARELLHYAAAAGPVRLEVNAPPRTPDAALAMPRIAEQAARGVKGMAVRFTDQPTSPTAMRLLLLFDPPPEPPARLLCSAPSLPLPVPEPGRLRLNAVFCDGTTFIADATAAAAARTSAGIERLIWRTTARLFPDDYAETYGLRRLIRPTGTSGLTTP